jgi:hypothetical protein
MESKLSSSSSSTVPTFMNSLASSSAGESPSTETPSPSVRPRTVPLVPHLGQVQLRDDQAAFAMSQSSSSSLLETEGKLGPRPQEGRSPSSTFAQIDPHFIGVQNESKTLDLE